MNANFHPAVALSSLLVFVVSWLLFDMSVLQPKRVVEAEIHSLRSELSALFERGEASLRTLQSMPQFASVPGSEATGGAPADLHQHVRDSLSSAGGNLVSSQAANGGSPVLIRARMDEEGLLRFARLIEAGPEGLQFVSLEVYPVPGQPGSANLEVTALIREAVPHAD